MQIKFKVTEVNEKKAILISENDQQISWPLSFLDQQPKIGDLIEFNIGEKPQTSAKDILNELLDTSE